MLRTAKRAGLFMGRPSSSGAMSYATAIGPGAASTSSGSSSKANACSSSSPDSIAGSLAPASNT
jgi:hypothetical protein